jgi:hypothetical protein
MNKKTNSEDYPCIDTKTFSKGTRLLVETVANVYEIIFLNPKSGEISILGGKRFPSITPAIFMGSVLKADEGEYVVDPHIIKYNHKMQLTTIGVSGAKKAVITNNVISAKIIAPDGKWSYEVWKENK